MDRPRRSVFVGRGGRWVVSAVQTLAGAALVAVFGGFRGRMASGAGVLFARRSRFPLARLVVPVDPERLPASLAVEVLMTGGPKQLGISVDGCTLFDETINRRWSGTFELGDCAPEPPALEITLLSDTHVPAARDTRSLGVAVSRIELRTEGPAP